MKKIFALLLLSFCALLPAANKLEVVEIQAPAEVSPGQNAAAHITLKVLEIEGNNYLRPGGYWNFPQSKLNSNIPAQQVTPWRFRNFKVGDTLKYTARFTVPENVKPGEIGSVTFRIRSPHLKKYATLKGSARATFKVRSAQKVDLTVPADKIKLPTVLVPSVNKAPVIDGKCDEKVWQQAAELPIMTNSFNGQKADLPARLKIMTDKKYIYLAMLAEDPDAENLQIRKFPMHDAKVWNNDSMECFFTPDIYMGEYVQFIADLAGHHYDDANGDYHGFNPKWNSAAQRSSSGWVIEAAIPVDAITKNKIENGTIWRGGFFRYARRARCNSGWTTTMGSHNSVTMHGYLCFGSLQDVLKKQSSFADSITGKSSAAMRKLADQIKAVCNGPASSNPDQLPQALQQLSELRKSFEKLNFSERFAQSKLPLVIQSVSPYKNTVAPDSHIQSPAVQKEFFPGEVKDLAWNLTNISSKTITVRAGLFGVPADKFVNHRRSRDFMLQGIPGFPSEMFAPAPTAAFDGRCVHDVLAPNPAGVWRIAPGETAQIYIRVSADGSLPKNEGSLVIEGIDNGAMTAAALPVHFTIIGNNKLSSQTKPYIFGWDYIPEKFASQRPLLVKKHNAMLKKYGFNTKMLSGLRHFPRPKADKDGNLRGKLDFTVLKEHMKRSGKWFDHCYLDLAIWEKKVLRRDLFGLDFYSQAYEKAFKTWFSACADALKQVGISNQQLLVCPVDECSDKRAETIARWIKECRPQVRIILDSQRDDMKQVKSIDRYVDVWMPNYRTLQQEALQEFHQYLVQKGKPRLLYYYCSGGNEKLKDPYKDYTLKFYGTFARDFGGLGYWAAGQYYGSPWYRRAYERTCDTALVYPVENAVIPSRRLAAWHRGVQDLWLLRETALRYKNNAEIQQKLRKAAQNAADYPNDSTRAESLRKYCRQLLAAAPKSTN